MTAAMLLVLVALLAPGCGTSSKTLRAGISPRSSTPLLTVRIMPLSRVQAECKNVSAGGCAQIDVIAGVAHCTLIVPSDTSHAAEIWTEEFCHCLAGAQPGALPGTGFDDPCHQGRRDPLQIRMR